MKHIERTFAAPLTFVWIGFVCAISFMEAWIKFTAPDVTVAIGLAIGQVVFAALNKVELFLAVAIACTFIRGDTKLIAREWTFLTAITILLFQTFLLLPELSSRVDIYLAGRTPPASSLHQIYVMLELTKVIALAIFGIKH
jgi:uncharacterized membrane protein (DUF485 family)